MLRKYDIKFYATVNPHSYLHNKCFNGWQSDSDHLIDQTDDICVIDNLILTI